MIVSDQDVDNADSVIHDNDGKVSLSTASAPTALLKLGKSRAHPGVSREVKADFHDKARFAQAGQVEKTDENIPP